jgi:flagellar capping protein FliD
MNIEKIKLDLALRVQNLIASQKEIKNQNIKIVYKVKTWREKVADTEELVKNVYDTLHEVWLHQRLRTYCK